MRHYATRVLSLFALFSTGSLAVPAHGAWRPEGPFIAHAVDLASDPAKPGTVYAATAYGGIWRSDDGGATWELPGDDMTSRDTTWIEVDPSDPATLWAGVESEEGDPMLWRSRDRAVSFEQVTGPVKDDPSGMSAIGLRIAFSPSEPATIYLPATNLHYRSTDGGKSWRELRVPGQEVYVFAVDPNNPKVVYAGGRGEQRHLSRSEDGGRTWKGVGDGLPDSSVHLLLVDPARPATIYAVSGFNELSVSLDRGDHWTALRNPSDGTDEVYNLHFDPSDSKVLWLAGDSGLFRSSNAGRTWIRYDGGTGRYVCQDVVFDPRDPRRMLVATAGTGIYRSSDGGASWILSNDAFAAGWIDALYLPAKPGPLFAQSSNGLFRRDPSGSWTEVVAPFEEQDAVELDGILFDRAAPRTAYAFASSSLWRSVDGGVTWHEPEEREPSTRQRLKDELESVEPQSLAQDPGNPKILWAGSWSSRSAGRAIAKSSDGGRSFKASGEGITGEKVRRLVAVAPGVVFAVVDESALFRTTDGGSSWKRRSEGLPEAELRALAADPTRPGRLFVASADGLFRSEDNGGSWERVSGDLQDEDIEAVVVSTSGQVYLGNFGGVFRSSDHGESWIGMSNGLPNTDVRALAFGADGRLWAGTAGGSAWSIEIP